MAVIPSVQNLRSVLQNVLFVPFAYMFFFNMIPLFLTAWDNANRLQDRLQDQFRGRGNTYDFIIVGGGTSGCIVANRLSEYYTVLLLEAGGPENPLQLVPGLSMNFLNQPQTDWSHKTIPQNKACLNSVNQQSSISSGKAMGGSSTLDGMGFLRGHPVDFDNWALITGDRSWSYAEVLPYFRRSEEFIGTTTDTAARGADGEMRIRQPDFTGLGDEWVKAGLELGFPNVDFNGRYTQGFGMLQYPIRRGMRQSTASAFISPIRMGPKLRVLRNAHVTKILFRDMSNMAYGVEYERFGRTDLAIASREVIVTCGSMGSAKLLMLSGIGPRQHLQNIGIPVRADLPVGQNMQDHLGVQLGPFFINSPKTFLLDRDVTPENILLWTVKGRGPLTTTGLQGSASMSSSAAISRGEQNWSDIQLILQGQGVHQNYPEQFARAHGVQQDEMVTYYENAVGRDSFNIRVIGARPTSWGTVQLTSASPKDPLTINPRYMEDNGETDFKCLMEGVEMAMRIAENTTAFQSVGTQFTTVKLPGCEAFEFRSRPYWECYVRRFTMSENHPVGTVAMGAVLDSNLKVRGTKGLRVMDASVQPTIVSVGTLASTMMIAEKGADSVLREYGTRMGNRGLADAVFGRNGIINRNPVMRLISREFDRINPLPALFRNPTNRTDFNPFSTFLGFLGLGGGGNSGVGGNFLQNLFNPSSVNGNNVNSPSILESILGTGNSNANNNANSGGLLQQLFAGLTPRSVNQTNSNPPPFTNIFGNSGTTPPSNSNSTTPNNIFEILFPPRNTNAAPTTTPSPFGNLFGNFRNNQNSDNNNNNQNNNIFGAFFRPRNTSFSNSNSLFSGLFGGGRTANTNTNSNSNNPGLFAQLFPPPNPNRTSLFQTIFGSGSSSVNNNVNTNSNNNNANSIQLNATTNSTRTNRETNETAMTYALNQIQLAFEDNATRYAHLLNATSSYSKESNEVL